MFKLKEIIDITDGQTVSVNGEIKISSISTDSRTIKKGELFIALKGKYFDGTKFINDVFKKGAVAALINSNSDASGGLPIIKVEDTKRALGAIAKAHRGKFNIPVIAITGSNGKTTTKDMIAHILGKSFKVLKSEGNYNNEIGVAKTVLRLVDEDMAVAEIGANSFGEVGYNAGILKPSAAIITNIGPSHLEGLKDKEGVLKEKISLVESLGKGGVWFKNCDDELLGRIDYKDIKIITYGINKNGVDFKADKIKEAPSTLKFNCRGRSFEIPLLGIHNIYNALAAIACCSLFTDFDSTREALLDFKGLHMRMEALDCGNFKIINDCYNSNPASFKCAVSCLRGYPSTGKKIVVTADMLELGRDSDSLHYESGKFLAEAKAADFLITLGEGAVHIARGALDYRMDKKRVRSFENKDELISFLRNIVSEGDIVLIKGSRGMKMEEIADCFTTCSTR